MGGSREDRDRPSRARRFLGLLVLGLSACGNVERDARRWIPLAKGFAPPPAAVHVEAGDLLRLRFDPQGTGVWVDRTVLRSAWQETRRRAGEREWSTTIPGLTGSGRPGRVELRAGERMFTLVNESEQRRNPDSPIGAGVFCLSGARLVLRLPGEEEPPSETVLSSWVERGHQENGVWRAIARDIVADGLSLYPGERAEIRCELPAHSALRFATLARTLVQPGCVRFRVALDGEPLFDQEQSSELDSLPVRHVIALPEAERAEVSLSFEVSGDPALCVFAAPLVGPAVTGTYGSRPWAPARPDVVLFLADTLRADCLAAYGGDPELTPNLNSLAARSVCFSQARAPAVWTLPSHASLFSSLLPLQHGAVLAGRSFPQDVLTLAEHFAAHGYRTGAVTESGWVSRRVGFDQGFEWFEERDRPLVKTLAAARAFLENDDGRPVFLFVHTYRTHSPYRRGAEESQGGLAALVARARARWQETGGGAPGEAREPGTLLSEVGADFAEEYRALYHDGVRALDEQMGLFSADLEALGIFPGGYLVFTSDHGEAFYEHGDQGHTGAPYEEKARVPLLFFGGGLSARDIPLGASSIDIAPTLSDLCGLPRPPAWYGKSLFALDHERVLFSYFQTQHEAQLAAVQGPRKILVRSTPQDLTAELTRGDLQAAFLLTRDPLEREDLLTRETWPREMASEVVPLWEILSRPLFQSRDADIDAELLQQLQALGYMK